MRKTAEQIKTCLGNDQDFGPARDFGRHGGHNRQIPNGTAQSTILRRAAQDRVPNPSAFAKTGASLGGKPFREGNSRTMLPRCLGLHFWRAMWAYESEFGWLDFAVAMQLRGKEPNRMASMKIDGNRPRFGRRIKHQSLICTRQRGGNFLRTTGHFYLGGLPLFAPTEQPQHTKPRLGVAI